MSAPDFDPASPIAHILTRQPHTHARRIAVALAAALLCAPMASAHAEDLSGILGIVEGMPEGTWAKVNQNTFSSVWTPPALRTSPYGGNIKGIIAAWSGFAWDSQRSDLIIWGGGHATYAGNDVYRFRGSTLQWERASLPSKLQILPNSNVYIAVDGTSNAPTASHTYDNNVYLKNADRFLTFGGASFQGASIFKTSNGSGGIRSTGPYTWDPSKADGNKVGGTTGSGTNPATLGGRMWQNRDIFASGAAGLPNGVATGVAAYANEGGKDVVYFTAKTTGTAAHLFKYTINDFEDPNQDTLVQVGRNATTFGNQGSADLDFNSNVFLRTGANVSMPFLFWDLNKAGPTNPDVRLVPIDLTGGAFNSFVVGLQGDHRDLGLDYDPLRDRYLLWGGNNQVWELNDPNGAVSASGWTLKMDSIAGAAGPAGPNAPGGILGKWHYAENLDAYVALRDPVLGEVWVYKPTGWISPLAASSGAALALTAVAAVPEPSTYMLWTAGLLLLAMWNRRRSGWRTFIPG